MLGSCVATVLACLVAQGGPTSPTPQTLTENDWQKIVGVSEPTVSPDGKRVAFLVSHVVWNEDKRNTELVMMDVATRAQRTMTYDRKGLSDPAFSPDGTRLSFVADGPGDDAQSQVYVMPLDGGDARPVTDAKEGVDQYAWRPDGKAIAYVSQDAKSDRKGAERFRDSFVFTTEPITQRGAILPSHLYVVPATGGKADQLTSGSKTVLSGEAQSSISWSADGKTIAFAIAPNAILNDQTFSHVVLVDVASKEIRSLTSHAAYESSPLFSPDGKHIAYTYSNGDGQVNLQRVYVTTPGGGDGKPATPESFDRTVVDYGWAPDSKSLLFLTPDRTTGAVWSLPLDGTPQRRNLGDVYVNSSIDGTLGPSGEYIFTASTPQRPQELYMATPGSAERISDYNGAIAALDLAKNETIEFPTTTGVTADAVLYTPPGFKAGTKYPLVVFIHGGPTGSSTRGFSFAAQLMAARGWLVLQPNYRGSDNLGIAYQRAVLYDPEEGPGKDIMAAVDAVRARGIVDDSRIAVSGWSYGGIMTAWMISKYHIWAAAVSGASVNDWLTDYGVADDSLSDVALFHGSPYVAGNAEEWRRASAITYAKDVTTPVLILSDIGDNRDPFATSSMYWRALRDNHKEAMLRAWPVYGHFPRDPVRVADVYHYWIDFIAQHFAKSTQTTSAITPRSTNPVSP